MIDRHRYRRLRIAVWLTVFSSLAACGGGGPPAGGRVLILGLDGFDPRAVDLLMSEGKMPHFARLRREGAYGRLLSTKPLLSPIVWTTIATGKTPDHHGIGHFTAIDNATGATRPVTSRMRRVKALWNIASDSQRDVAVVGWWATWPPEPVHGSVVSDHAAYHFLFQEGFESAAPGRETTYPPELAERIAPLLRRPDGLSYEEIAPFVAIDPAELERERQQPFDFEDELRHFEWALATAESYQQIGLKLWREERPDLQLVYIEGTDSVAHLFGHLFRADGLAGELARQQQRFGRTVEQMYLFADRLVGSYLDTIDDDTTLVVLSDHGFDLGTLHDNPNQANDMRRVSERFHNIEGVLYLWGRGVEPRARLQRPAILDVAPTVLTLLGLPPAADMPGRVLSEALSAPPSAQRVVSYEDATSSRTLVAAAADDAADAGANAPDEEPQVDRAVLERLRSLGYLGGSGSGDTPSTGAETGSAGGPVGDAASGSGRELSPTSDRNLAGILFEEGNFEQAARLYERLLADDADNPALRTSFAGTLGALGRFDEALAQLEIAVAADPLNIEAYHNRAVILERRGQRDAAIEDYRRAVRYAPDYQPSRDALLRLTGSPLSDPPTSEAEQQAYALAQQASEAARRADYDAAWRLLEEAVRLAPRYAMVYQYRSNVAFLRNDRAAAIQALEKALEIEPDNALFRENLNRLRAR